MADCLDVGEPPPQLTDEVDDLPPGLVADASHQVDIADRVLQQVADGQDIRPLQGVAGTGAQAQGGDRRIQFRLFQADTLRSTSSPLGVLIFRCSASLNTCCQAQRISSALWNRLDGSRCSALRKNSTSPSRTLGSNFSASITSSLSVIAGSDLPSPHCGNTPAPSVIS